jgi:pseudaminic acid synthase
MTEKTYIIAELSANHDNDLDLAKRTIEAMAKAGADAVKVQTFTADSITLDSDKPWFMAREDSLWAGTRLYELYQKAALPYEWHAELKKEAENVGLDFFSAPFDKIAVDFLDKLGVPKFKIASLEITDIPLIKYTASKNKPMIISTGVAEYNDIQLAVEACRKVGNNDITILKCTSAYPTPLDEVNLNLIPKIKSDFDVKVGLSDHTLGIEVPIAAVALGASVVEKHFILDKQNSTSVDKDFSLDAIEFESMVKAIRLTEQALGEANYSLSPKAKSATKSVRSLFAVEDIAEGEMLTEKNVRSIRPGLGLHPKHLPDLMGKKARVFIEKGTPLSFDLIN